MKTFSISSVSRAIVFLGIFTALFVGAAEDSSAQYTHIYVDAIHGNDGLGTGLKAAPYQSITKALSTINNTSGYIIKCNPGIYSQNETFPLRMKDNVHLAATRGAKETVIRINNQSSSWSTFIPYAVNPGIYVKDVLVVYNQGSYPTEAPFINGFTFQGGDVQIYTSCAQGGQGRVSNCFMDMRTINRNTTPPTPSTPSFAFLITAPSNPETGHVPTIFQIINNTIMENWDKELGLTAGDKVGICDVIDNSGNPAVPLMGGNLLSVQNNLIRSMPGNLQTALLGVDSWATCAWNPATAAFVDTNAFPTGKAMATSITGRYRSQFANPNRVPTAAVYLVTPIYPLPPLSGEVDPVHVGEMLNWNAYSAVNPPYPAYPNDPWVRDFRLMYNSPLVDQGLSPYLITTPTVQFRRMQARNGVIHDDYYIPSIMDKLVMDANSFKWEISSFIWDGEGYGNIREERNSIDIGFDETGAFQVAGCYGNDSLCHNIVNNGLSTVIKLPLHYPNGNPDRHHFFPRFPATPLNDTKDVVMYMCPAYHSQQGWDAVPGTNYDYSLKFRAPVDPIHAWGMLNYLSLPSLQFPPDIPLGRWFLYNIFTSPCTYLLTWTSQQPSPSLTLTAWQNMIDGNSYQFYYNLWPTTADIGQPPVIHNQQVMYSDYNGALMESNLQSDFL